MPAHWHPAFRPNADADPRVEGEYEHDHEHEERGMNITSQESIAVTQEIEQHVEVAPTNPGSSEVQGQVTADAQGPVSRRTSWAQTATESAAVQAEEDDWSARDTDTFAASIQEEIECRAAKTEEETAALMREEAERSATIDSVEGEVMATSEDVQPVMTADDAGGDQQADGYDYQGDVSQMEEAVDEAPSAPLLMDEEVLPTVEQDAPPTQDDLSVMEEFDGAPAPGQPLPKAQVAPGHLDRSFTTNFTELPRRDTEQEQSEPRQPENPISEGWPSIGDDKTFGELLGDDTPVAATQDILEKEAPSNAPSADDGWGAVGEDNAFGQLQAQPQVADDDFSGEDGMQAEYEPISTNDPWGAAVDDDAFGEMRSQPQTHPADDAWGADVNDDTFGELMGGEESIAALPVQPPDSLPAVDAPAAQPEDKPEEDLAAMWQAALDDDELLDESNDLDPSTFFGDDDDGFLLDDGDELLTSTPIPEANPAPAPTPAPAQPQRSTTNPYMPAQASVQNSPQVNPYAVPSHELMGQSIGRSAGTPSTGLFDVYGHSQQAQSAPQRPSAQTAQSFADRSKGGYESPYDLPMDVVKQPRQRPRQPQAPASGNQSVPMPPPRSTSMTSQSAADVTPPSMSGPVPAVPPPTSVSGTVPAKTTPKTNSGFFEDLPVAPKPRARPSGAYTPQPQASSMPPPGQMPPTQLPPRGPVAPPMQPPQRPEAPPAPVQQPVYGGFQQPDRLPLLPDQPTASPQNQMQPPPVPSQNHRYSPSLPTPAQTQNRFSPAPPSQGPAAAASRYSPAPGALQKRYSAGPATTHVPPGVQQGHPFAPRTSSPLAFHTDKPHPPLPNELQRNAPSLPSSPPMANGSRTSMSMSPDRTASMGYSPIEQRTPASHLASPPSRPKTQSPPTVMKQARYLMQAPERSTSTTAVPKVHLSHRRQFSRDLPFVEPNDERIHDPLQRWKGQPIFRWSSSGSIVSSFPKQTPFYAAGHGIPSIKCTPGDISIQGATTFMPMDDRNAKFPGPLTTKAKGRKKDVLAWMAGKIEDLERAAEAVRLDFNMDPHLRKRVEEKLVLWKIVKIFVDHDGAVEGSQKIEEEVRAVLLPDLAQMAQAMDSTGTPGGQADPVDKTVVVQIRQALLEGQRERAVWLAEEKKMWGHAMLLASTMGPEMWKQVIQSFVRSQVKTVGSDARSLAALYQVFAGNSEECVDELVPPSARAGFQMVSKSDGVATGNPLEGLDQWRETLGLVAGNRTPNDTQSILALGKLLGGYGRAEAAHSCFLFARHVSKHSGADDAEVNFVILGADHTVGSFANDIDTILLTEIYEWASSLSAPSGTQAYMPHLQAFKLIHAQELAAHGLTSKAQAYCDHITSAYTSTTRPSQYYHPTFTQSVTDLSAFLSQSPHAGAQGLISKKAMNKVSSGAASWFTKFVSGDDGADAAGSHGAAGNDAEDRTPFGRVNGDSPSNLSPSASGTDLYNPMMGGAGMPFTGQVHGVSTPSAFHQPTSYMPSTSAPSKYAPISGGNKYAPGGAPAGLGVAAEIHPRPASTRSARSYTPAPVASSASSQPLAVPGRPGANRAASAYSADSRRGSAQFGSPQGSYQPSPQGSYQPSPLLAAQAGPYHGGVTSQPQVDEQAGMYGYQPHSTPSSEAGQGPYGYQPHVPAAQQPVEEEQEQEDAFARPPQPQHFDASGPEDAEGGGYEPPSAGVGYQPSPPASGYQPSPPASGYQPSPPATGYQPSPPTTGYQPSPPATGYQPSPPAADGYAPPSTYSGGYEPPSTATGGYEPPSTSGGGYEPPSYQPYVPDDEATTEDVKPKSKKSFMDDDEDDAAELAARAKAMQKAAADKAADDAFRKAAEADAAKDNKKHSNNQSLGGGPGEKKGWFGGWFKKDPNALEQQGNKPIRAKLGEESSFYYDEDLKKWVNKKGGGDESATPSAATPPPPRASGPPSRAVSGAVGSSGPPSRMVSAAMPGSGPPSRIGTPAEGGNAAPPLSAVPGGMMNGGSSGPPSRPSTGMSNASSLDDLLGGPPGGQRKVGGTVKKKKGGRYVDVMAK